MCSLSPDPPECPDRPGGGEEGEGDTREQQEKRLSHSSPTFPLLLRKDRWVVLLILELLCLWRCRVFGGVVSLELSCLWSCRVFGVIVSLELSCL